MQLDVAAVPRAQSSREGVAVRAVVNALVPLLLAAVLVAVLTDTIVNRIDPRELRLNTLLMGTRPFRVQTDLEAFVSAVASSALLFATAIAVAAAIGIPFGVLYTSWRNRPLRALVWAIATVGAILPSFFWAVAAELGVLFVASRTGVVLLPQAGFGIDEHLVLPTFALAARPAAYIFQLTASSIEEIRTREFVRTASAKGLSTRAVLVHHVLPNAAPSIVGAVLLAARSALSSLPVVEFVFVWGGAGLTFLQAVGARQATLAAGLALSFALVSVALTLATDLYSRRFLPAAR